MTIRYCIRCNKELIRPIPENADYVIAPDFIVQEPRDIFYALKHNAATKLKANPSPNAEGKPQSPKHINDSEYDSVEIPSIADSLLIEGCVKVIAKLELRDVQKTGLVCPACYEPTDTVIWGIHKNGK